jgi:hypothetical protein
MADPRDFLPSTLKAYMASGGAWGEFGSSTEHTRYAEPVDPKSRRRCHCGCKRRATHRGMANGVCLTEACEFAIMRWVKTGSTRVRFTDGG